MTDVTRAPGPTVDKKLILVVDDEFDLAATYEMLFGYYGYAVQVASNGQQALELARITPPDVVVSDYMMPVMDGAELLLAWRADPLLRHIPFIMTSAGVARADVDLPFDAFHSKPVRMPLLLDSIRKLTAR
ncbi:MAG: response regulator [Pseudomonadota bacterium]